MKKLALVVVLALSLAGCATGLGRGISYAFRGVPEEVPQAYDVVEAEYLRVSDIEIQDIKEGVAETPIGKARQGALLKDRLEAQGRVLEALRVLREYSAASTSEAASAARGAALAHQGELLELARDLLLGGK